MKSCKSCLYVLTHEQCTGCLGKQPYTYKNWIAGDGMARRHELEKSGERNIVIGGAGEAEVNIKWTPEAACENLFKVAEACGYSITKGRWEFAVSEIELSTPEGHFRLIWWNGVFHAIEKILTRTVWHCISI